MSEEDLSRPPQVFTHMGEEDFFRPPQVFTQMSEEDFKGATGLALKQFSGLDLIGYVFLSF